MGLREEDDEPMRADTAPAAKVKCLLVDDVQENLVALAALLRSDDVEVLVARSGLEALELLLAHDVALALLDVQMPEMDGFELAELIRGSERTRHVPLIFVTAGARDQYRLFKGYETGAVDFLYKPIDPHILRNKCEVFFELHRQKRALAYELRAKTETLRLNEMFMAVLGHDLRSPLSAILSSGYLLQRGQDPQTVQKIAARVVGSGQRMSRMIEDLLDVARARLAGGITLRCGPLDLGALIQRVVQEHQAAHPQRRIEYSQLGDVHGEWDADRLAQVATNLIGNALQHGRPDDAVEVALDGSVAQEVRFSVSNSGHIPAEVLPCIFDPFRGARREPGRDQGLGLGLYIVRQIVEAHRGSIDVTSDGRVVFGVCVPRHAAPCQHEADGGPSTVF